MKGRPIRQAPDDVCEKMRRAFQALMAEHGPDGDWNEALAAKTEEILGPFDREEVGTFGVRFTRVAPEPDGFHEYVTFYF
jgi:hypothetical protein